MSALLKVMSVRHGVKLDPPADTQLIIEARPHRPVAAILVATLRITYSWTGSAWKADWFAHGHKRLKSGKWSTAAIREIFTTWDAEEPDWVREAIDANWPAPLTSPADLPGGAA